ELTVRAIHSVCYCLFFFFSSRRRHTRCLSDWSSDVCSSDLIRPAATDGALSPPPRPLIFQARGGPSFGHSLSRPVSLEWAVRSGPCHCGQSSAEAEYNKNPVVRTLMTRFILIISFCLVFQDTNQASAWFVWADTEPLRVACVLLSRD